MIEKVLSRKELTDAPPVLIDVGASGKIHRNWRQIARYAICIAFDADDRDFAYVADESGKYRKLYIYNCIVSDQENPETNFYLTKSPHCSSLLEPDLEGVKDTAFASYFEVEKVLKLKTVTLPTVLKELGIAQVDWFKVDSQGIDLRLFQSLGDAIISKTLVAEFEPGIVDSYRGEDKMHRILAFMEQKKQFWLAKLIIKGAARISPAGLGSVYSSAWMRKLAMFSIKKSAGWGEMTYFNTFHNEGSFTFRDYLLAWVFATIEKQHGFALSLSQSAKARFNDSLLSEMESYSKGQIRKSVWTIGFYPAIKTKLRMVLGWE